jgi:hypothetical protein
MAKKKAKGRAGGTPQRVPRKEPYSAQRMEAILARIKEQSSRIASLARTMEDARLDSLVIDGHQMLIRGLSRAGSTDAEGRFVVATCSWLFSVAVPSA